MKSRTIAIVIFYTDKNEIMLQNRKSMMKWGEEWGFWGGGLDEGETKEEVAKREIKEELDYDVKNLKYIGTLTEIITRYKNPNDKRKITLEIFITKIKEDRTLFKVHEGDGLKFFTIDEARKLKMVPIIDSKALDIVEKYLGS